MPIRARGRPTTGIWIRSERLRGGRRIGRGNTQGETNTVARTRSGFAAAATIAI